MKKTVRKEMTSKIISRPVYGKINVQISQIYQYGK